MFDNKLKFDKHIENICQKANWKLNALVRVTNYMKLPKKRISMNAFFKAQLNHCPVVSMVHSRFLNNKINRLHERCLRIIYNDKRSSFEELLVKDNSVSGRHNNIHTLAIEMYKLPNVSKFGNKYLLKLKIKTLSSGFKKKLENGSPLIAIQNLQNLYSQLRFYLTFYFRNNIFHNFTISYNFTTYREAVVRICS